MTERLLESMKKRTDEECVIVNVGSGASDGGKLDFENPSLTNKYSRGKAYGQSKLAQLLQTEHYSRTLPSRKF